MLDERSPSATAPGQEPASLDDDKLTYTLAEAASRLGISTWLAYEAAHRGELPVCLISPGSITACCWRCSGPTEPPRA